jgi:WD40 repeat protein
MAEKPKTKVFISYSRKNKAFVRKLNAALDEAGLDAWVDWDGIPLTVDWMNEITNSITSSNVFLFVMSPDSLKSEFCAKELELAIAGNKKIIPIVYAEPEKRQKVHAKLASSNWVFLRPKKEKFKEVLPKLIEAIFTDFDWVSDHTRLSQRAAEWNLKERNDSYLLRGSDLDNAEKWMTESTSSETRYVTPLQAEYIRASREYAIRRQRNFTRTIGLAMAATILLFVASLIQWQRAIANAELAQENALIAAANEKIALEQQQLAEQNAQRAAESENQAKAQSSAALAKALSEQPSQLDASTLLALESLSRFPSKDAEDVLRNNISKMPIPIAQLKHTGRIWNLILSPDGQFFVSTSADNTACVWTLKGEQKYCITHEDDVTDALITNNGTLLITASRDGSVRFWDFANGTPQDVFQLGSPILDLDINPRNTMVIAGREDEIVTIIDPNVRRIVYDFNFNNGAVNVVKFHPNGEWLSIGTKQGRIRTWKAKTSLLESGPRHDAEVFNFAISSDGKVMVSVSEDSTARISRAETGRETHVLKHPDWVEDVAFSPDNSWFVTASDDKIVRVFETATGIEKMRMYHSSFVQRVKVSPDGSWILTTGYDQTARLWDSHTGALVLEASLDGIGSALLFSQDGKQVIVGDRNGNVTIWDISSLYARVGYIEFDEFINRVRFDPSGNYVLINPDDKFIWQFPYEQITTITKGETGTVVFSTSDLTSLLEISPDSKWIAVSENSEVNRSQGILFNTETKETFILPHTSDITSLSFNSTNQFLATTNEGNNEVYIWDVASGAKIKTISFEEAVFTAIFNPKDSTLVIGLSDKFVIWDLTTEVQVNMLFHVGRIHLLAFNHDGNLLASASSDGSINIWDMTQSDITNPKYQFRQNGRVNAFDFNANKNWLAAASDDGFLYLFYLGVGEEVIRIPHGDTVSGVDFSTDGNLLTTVSRKTIQFFDVNLLIPISKEDLTQAACSRITRNLTPSEWASFFPQEQYQVMCEGLP